ncbi:hypothetical protein A7K94_0221965, partial [Modestobacter sp. VKM Ac-2676]
RVDQPAPAWDRSRTRLTSTLGATARGPLTLDLVAQGPHALVAGTTGSGKSELLQTLVAGLACTTHRIGAASCWSTTRAAPPSPRRRRCRTPSGCSPIWTTSRPRGRCVPWPPS